MKETLGPFLMKPSYKSMGFWICGDSTVMTVSIRVFKGTTLIDEFPLRPLENSRYNIFLGETRTQLIPLTTYTYQVLVDGKIELFGLNNTDFRFTTFPENESSQSKFALVSCNGIEEFEKHSKDGNSAWTMWNRLEQISDSDPDILFLVLGGDQVYMDDTFPSMKQFRFMSDEKVRKKIKDTYFKYWGDISYRKLMARIPSFLMWDDHDLIDGFGSRPEQFSRANTERGQWPRYRKLLTEAFFEFQAVRNPGTISSTGPFTNSFVFQKKGFVLLDLRSERNVTLGQLLGQKQKDYVTSRVQSMIESGVNTIFFLTPVTVARMGGKIESSIGTVANYLWKLGHNIGGNSTIRRSFFWTACAVIAFLAINLRISGGAGDMAALFLGLFCGVNLFFDAFQSKNYLSSFWTNIFRSTNGVIIAAVIYTEYMNLTSSNFWAAVVTEAPSALSYLKNVLISISVMFICGNLYYYLDKSGKKLKALIAIGGAAFGAAFFFLFWLGMPGRNSSFGVWMLPVIITQLLGFVFVTLSFLEAIGVIDLVAGLDDDIKDSWSSESNRRELTWLYNLFSEIQSKGIRPVILTGDIHTGGISKISPDSNFSDRNKIIHQIVSSPIGYVPMGPMVEKLTSSNFINEIHLENKSIYSYNLFYMCKRNFTIVKPSEASSAIEAEFYFEGMESSEIVSIN